ncbi:SdpI family protein [Gracilibacillus phocaeensis]|uniref:SdpI family protein n=1 Tax=Gracilibacillus phocaeensis TaxID=2042304 RepID=UPI0013EF0F97|nr:SdpI family protein [Gracilibacillus phocaeensis]
MYKHLGAIALIIATLGMWFISYPYLPNDLPMHWGTDGSVTWSAPKSIGVLINMGLLILIYIMFVWIPKLDPKRKGYLLQSRAYRVVIYATMLLLVFVNVLVVVQSLGMDWNVEIIVPLAVGALFIVMGNYMQAVKSNWLMGIRTPWTLSSEKVWQKTNRLGSRLFILAGLSFFIIPFIDLNLAVYFIITGALLIAIILTVYSYVVYKQEQKEDYQ